MEIEVLPFQPYHVDMIKAQPAQAAELGDPTMGHLHLRQRLGPALSLRAGGEIVACGGIARANPQYGFIWAILGETSGRYMVRIVRVMRRVIDMVQMRRIEATTPAWFAAGRRLLEDFLGFEFEGEARGMGANGETHLRFARVRL